MTDQVLRDSGLADIDPEFQQFAVDPRLVGVTLKPSRPGLPLR